MRHLFYFAAYSCTLISTATGSIFKWGRQADQRWDPPQETDKMGIYADLSHPEPTPPPKGSIAEIEKRATTNDTFGYFNGNPSRLDKLHDLCHAY